MTNMVYGYARVSTRQQDLSRQLDLLDRYECNKIYTEKISGVRANRPELNKLKKRVKENDKIIIESFSRLEGLESARARGNIGGRPRIDPALIQHALHLYQKEGKAVVDICAQTGLKRSTFYRYLSLEKDEVIS